MARERVEQQPAATGSTLIVLVGLGIAFLLFMAFLNVVKSGSLLNESNLLRSVDFLRRGRSSVSRLRSDRRRVVCEVCLVCNLGWLDRKYRRGCSSLV